MSAHLAALMSGILQTYFFVASFIPWVLIDRVGRRPLFVPCVAAMAVVMAIQAGFTYKVEFGKSTHGAGIGATVMLFLFETFFTIGFQATVWVYPSEVLPIRIRQRGSSLSTAANWICNYAVVQFTPPALDNIGYKLYIVFAVLNAFFAVCIYFFMPETKGLELEEVDKLFAKRDILPDASYSNPQAPRAPAESLKEEAMIEHDENSGL